MEDTVSSASCFVLRTRIQLEFNCMVRLTGFEPVISWTATRRSIQTELRAHKYTKKSHERLPFMPKLDNLLNLFIKKKESQSGSPISLMDRIIDQSSLARFYCTRVPCLQQSEICHQTHYRSKTATLFQALMQVFRLRTTQQELQQQQLEQQLLSLCLSFSFS